MIYAFFKRRNESYFLFRFKLPRMDWKPGRWSARSWRGKGWEGSQWDWAHACSDEPLWLLCPGQYLNISRGRINPPSQGRNRGEGGWCWAYFRLPLLFLITFYKHQLFFQTFIFCKHSFFTIHPLFYNKKLV